MITAHRSKSRLGGRGLAPCGWVLALLAFSGCEEKEETPAPSVSTPPALHIIHPRREKISHIVGQPSFVQSYERTSIYPKMTGYIEKWNVDIGDRVQKGDVLAELFVPELRELWGTKEATVAHDRERLRHAQKEVEVATADVEAAKARLIEAQKMLAAYQAKVDRWLSEVDRLAEEVRKRVVAPQILLESQMQLKADQAMWDAQNATVLRTEKDLLAKTASMEAAEIEVEVARTELRVAESESRRLQALVGYLKLFAPYDGIIISRNANTWDFVLPTEGDPTAEDRAPHLSPGRQAAPIYVVDRTDIVRIFVDIPERDANYVNVGTPANVKIWGYKDTWISASVTRMAWALDTKSRTMRAEIDLPNYDSKILPGMYAYGKIIVEHPATMLLPKFALSHTGGKSFIWLYHKGKAKRTEIETGITEEKWIEVTARGTDSKYHGHEEWTEIDGSEEVLVGPKLSTLTDGTEVRIDNSPAKLPERPIDRKNNAVVAP